MFLWKKNASDIFLSIGDIHEVECVTVAVEYVIY